MSRLSRIRGCHRARMNSVKQQKSAKQQINEYAQQQGMPLPVYTTDRTGPDHLPVFLSEIKFEDYVHRSRSVGRTIKDAQRNAAQEFLDLLHRGQLGRSRSARGGSRIRR